MQHLEGSFKTVRDAKIYYQGWLPEGEAKGVLLVVHGLGEHCGRYMNVVNHFVPLGYAVYGLDHLGHGKSEGQRVYVDCFDDYTESLTKFYEMVTKWQAGKDVIILGHSMGGLITTYYLLDNQDKFKAAVISAPAVEIGESISAVTIMMSKVMAKIVPRMGLMALDSSTVSRDPEVVEAYDNDPLVYRGKITARLGSEMLAAMMRIGKEGGQITLPVIILQGGEDKLVAPSGAQLLYDQIQSDNKVLKVYDGLFHEVFNEPEKDQVLGDVEAWLAAV